MRHPAIRKFLLWLGPAVGGGTISVAAVFPKFNAAVERYAISIWERVMNGDLVAILMVAVPITIWTAAFAYASSPRPRRSLYTKRSLEGMRRAIEMAERPPKK